MVRRDKSIERRLLDLQKQFLLSRDETIRQQYRLLHDQWMNRRTTATASGPGASGTSPSTAKSQGSAGPVTDHTNQGG